ncbi:hypothetical protein EI94DRAFT_1745734 [Lactarius quietus]|nr:hypothetical protein EI94DRAFT_1745734 [Lactarius quietus]
MHSTHFPLPYFQMVVTVLLASVSLTSAQAAVKQNVAMYPNWKCAGCWNDTNPDQSVRALNTEVTVPGGLANASVENCIGECISLKFNIAGLELNKCWCANRLTADSGSAPILVANCLNPCTGDPNEFCGGNGALLVYYNNA